MNRRQFLKRSAMAAVAVSVAPAAMLTADKWAITTEPIPIAFVDYMGAMMPSLFLQFRVSDSERKQYRAWTDDEKGNLVKKTDWKDFSSAISEGEIMGHLHDA